MSNTITIKESIFIAQPPNVVYDFTQDYSKRSLWDVLIKDATILEEEPNRLVQIKAKDGSNMIIRYKLERLPEKTSLAIVETDSKIMIGGGGSWTYEAKDGGTLWTQVNTIQLKDNFLAKLVMPIVRKYFKNKAVNAMQKAREMMEKG